MQLSQILCNECYVYFDTYYVPTYYVHACDVWLSFQRINQISYFNLKYYVYVVRIVRIVRKKSRVWLMCASQYNIIIIAIVKSVYILYITYILLHRYSGIKDKMYLMNFISGILKIRKLIFVFILYFLFINTKYYNLFSFTIFILQKYEMF